MAVEFHRLATCNAPLLLEGEGVHLFTRLRNDEERALHFLELVVLEAEELLAEELCEFSTIAARILDLLALLELIQAGLFILLTSGICKAIKRVDCVEAMSALIAIAEVFQEEGYLSVKLFDCRGVSDSLLANVEAAVLANRACLNPPNRFGVKRIAAFAVVTEPLEVIGVFVVVASDDFVLEQTLARTGVAHDLQDGSEGRTHASLCATAEKVKQVAPHVHPRCFVYCHTGSLFKE